MDCWTSCTSVAKQKRKMMKKGLGLSALLGLLVVGATGLVSKQRGSWLRIFARKFVRVLHFWKQGLLKNEDAKLERVLYRIDEVNLEDPRTDEDEPQEFLYAKRMTEALDKFWHEYYGPAGAPEELQIAARAQHIARWKSPRSSYPDGRAGYLKWRSDLYVFHGTLARDIMLEEGYSEEKAEKVKYLLSKKGIKPKEVSERDPWSQLLEDVVCLVFLKYYWKPFSKREFEEDKLITIVQRTWAKMSENGHQAALKLDYGDRELEIIKKALGA